MSIEINVEPVDAKYGEKMIEIKIRFWTNMAGEGKILPKHAFTSGVVTMESNESHGLISSKPLPFHSLLDLLAVIEKTLIEHEICLIPGRQMGKYIALI